jgi:hypothetical protein
MKKEEEEEEKERVGIKVEITKNILATFVYV